jgi:hypothetical protein
MTPRLRCAGWAALALAAVVATETPALAAACSTEPGWRYVETEGLAKRTAEIDKLHFAKAAKMAVGEKPEDKRIRGIKDAGENYKVEVTRNQDLMTFTFKDEQGRPGMLAFRMPATINIFEVDPRTIVSAQGQGPALYKEWRITAYTTRGDGLFKAAVTRNTKITLVLHGSGNACTTADQFTAWTMQVVGPANKFTLYGTLDKAAQ